MKKLILIILVSVYSFGSIGTIMALKGKAKVKRSINLKAKMGMKLLEGDIILTSALSKMQVILLDDTVVTIGANSSFGFKEFKFDGTKNSKVTLNANKGYFRTITGRTGKIAPDRFRVKTLTATIGVRGTDFGGYISKEKEIIQCYSGSIWVKLDKGGIKDVLSNMLIEINDHQINVRKISSQKTSINKENRNNKATNKPKSQKMNRPKAIQKINNNQHINPKAISDVSTENVKPEDL